MDVEPSPAVRSAKEWFELIDADGSGELDQDELATLYQKARGEKLRGKQVFMPTAPAFARVSTTSAFALRLPRHLKLFTDPCVSRDLWPATMYQHQLKAAMSEMDKDGDGTISYTEFESWWRNNGGDLEKHRPLAFTVVLPDLNLLLVRTASTQPTSESELGHQGGHVRPSPHAHSAACSCRPDHLKCCFVCDVRCAAFHHRWPVTQQKNSAGYWASRRCCGSLERDSSARLLQFWQGCGDIAASLSRETWQVSLHGSE